MKNHHQRQQQYQFTSYHSPKFQERKLTYVSPPRFSIHQQRQKIFDNAFLVSSSKLKARVINKYTTEKYDQIINNCEEKIIKSSKPYKQLQREVNFIKHNHNEKKQKIQQVIKEIQKQKAAIQRKKQELKKERNRQKNTLQTMVSQFIKLRANNELISDRIQQKIMDPEYNHNIDPDRMTYEELLQLQEKIGNVSRGIHPQQIDLMPKHLFKYCQKRQEQDKMCTICFEYFEQQQQMFIFKCAHKFHTQCIKMWLMKEKKCPNCKQQIQFI